MAALTITTWLWGDKYSETDIVKLAAGVNRHLKQPYRFVVISDRDIEIDGTSNYAIPDTDRHLLEVKGCFVRLRQFDPAWQQATQIEDRLVCIDLDTVITGPLDRLFDRPEPFVIMQGGNFKNPCPYVGALMMVRAGANPEVWSDFSLDAASKIKFHEFPDDQGWLWHVLPNAAGWTCGVKTGVYVFQKPGWVGSDGLPAGARLVTFTGWRSPEKFKHLDWVKEHWHA